MGTNPPGAPKGNAGLRLLLPGRQPLPGTASEAEVGGLPAASVSGRAEEASEAGGPGRDGGRRPGPEQERAQEKQFPPALSFFIYNLRFGPREGEAGAGRVGVRGRQRAPGRGAAGWGPPGQPRGAPGVVACQSPLTDWPLPDCFVLGVRQGPDNAAGSGYRSQISACLLGEGSSG